MIKERQWLFRPLPPVPPLRWLNLNQLFIWACFFLSKQLSLTCNGLSKFYLNWPICKDLLLVIELLKEQLTGLQSALGQCHTEMALAGIRAGPLFWVLVIMVVGAVFLGGVRIAWHARRDGFFIVDRWVILTIFAVVITKITVIWKFILVVFFLLLSFLYVTCPLFFKLVLKFIFFN